MRCVSRAAPCSAQNPCARHSTTEIAAVGAAMAHYHSCVCVHLLLQGNLCWDAALEFALSSQSVHAPVMDPDNKVMDPE